MTGLGFITLRRLRRLKSETRLVRLGNDDVRSLEDVSSARSPSSRSIAISLTLNVSSGPSGTTRWEDVAEVVSRELVRRLRYLV
jgi:hypothetical protein